jgi:lipoprotein-releasing system permease protein
VLFSGPLQGQGGVVKGLPREAGGELKELERYLVSGSIAALEDKSGYPQVLLGSKLAQRTGMEKGSIVTVISPTGELTPLGPRPSYHRFRVGGIFETGFFDVDNSWGYASLEEVQRVMGTPGAVNAIELKLDDIHAAPEVTAAAGALTGTKLTATSWQESNRQILNALKMDRIVTLITISLIQLVAALNILISLIMMVMEKSKDIAILVAMGARWAQIRRIFILQGLYIGAVGTGIGLVLGYGLSWAAERFRWFSLDAEIYALSYVPFEPRALDAVWVAAAAMAVSFLATLYPARRATAVLPAEALRYE